MHHCPPGEALLEFTFTSDCYNIILFDMPKICCIFLDRQFLLLHSSVFRSSLKIRMAIYSYFLLQISNFNFLGSGPVLGQSCIEVSEMWKIFAACMLIFRIIKLSQRDLELLTLWRKHFQILAKYFQASLIE